MKRRSFLKGLGLGSVGAYLAPATLVKAIISAQRPGFFTTHYTGTGASQTIAHGLGLQPEFIMIKSFDEEGFTISDPTDSRWECIQFECPDQTHTWRK